MPSLVFSTVPVLSKATEIAVVPAPYDFWKVAPARLLNTAPRPLLMFPEPVQVVEPELLIVRAWKVTAAVIFGAAVAGARNIPPQGPLILLTPPLTPELWPELDPGRPVDCLFANCHQAVPSQCG